MNPELQDHRNRLLSVTAQFELCLWATDDAHILWPSLKDIELFSRSVVMLYRSFGSNKTAKHVTWKMVKRVTGEWASLKTVIPAIENLVTRYDLIVDVGPRTKLFHQHASAVLGETWTEKDIYGEASKLLWLQMPHSNEGELLMLLADPPQDRTKHQWRKFSKLLKDLLSDYNNAIVEKERLKGIGKDDVAWLRFQRMVEQCRKWDDRHSADHNRFVTFITGLQNPAFQSVLNRKTWTLIPSVSIKLLGKQRSRQGSRKRVKKHRAKKLATES